MIICLDDPNIQMIIPQIERRVITYGMRAHAEISASDVRLSRESFGSEFAVRRKGDQASLVAGLAGGEEPPAADEYPADDDIPESEF